MIVIPLPWDAPPLRSNGRESRYPKAAIIREIRSASFVHAKRRMQYGLYPFSSPVKIRFVWTVTTAHIRDAGSSAPTLKAAIDGLVDAGLLPHGDSWRYVPEESCRIERGLTAGCRIEITPDEEAAA